MIKRLINPLARHCISCLALGVSLAFTSQALATQVIANWNLVPFQRLNEPTKVGVVAFHETGANVTFSINGSVVATVDEPTMNDRVNVVEYWIEVDPADYPDGPITLEATAAPDGAGHDSRVLGARTLYANAGGTLGSSAVIWVSPTGNDTTGAGTEANPYATIKKGILSAGDGGTVYLQAGQYKLTATSTPSRLYWTTVMAAPGLDAEDVGILTKGPDSTSTNRYNAHKIRWHNVSLYCDRVGTSYGNIFYLNTGQQVWMDGAVMYDANGPFAGTTTMGGSGYASYQTNGVVRDVGNTNGGFRRNMLYQDICSDTFAGGTNLLAINVTIDTIDRGTTSAHPDFIQFYSPGNVMENIILYNVRAYNMAAQGLFGSDGDAEDVAFINLLLEATPGLSYRSQLTGVWRHALLWNTTIVNQTFDFRDSTNIADFDVRNCLFNRFTTDNLSHPSITIESNHTTSLAFDQTAPLGANATLGSPLFVDAANDDYRLDPASPAYETGAITPGVPADIDGVAYGPNPNRGAYSSGEPSGALIFEPFDYAATTTVSTAADSSADWGLTGTTWSGTNDIVTPGLSYPGLTTSGNALKFFSNVSSARNVDELQIPAEYIIPGTPAKLGVPDTTLWVSFLIRPDVADASGGTNSCGVQLVGATNGGAVKLAIGDSSGTSPNWGIGRYSTHNVSSISPTTGQTYLLVARLSFVSGSANDEVDLWVDPPLGATPPATPSAMLRNLDIGAFHQILLKGNRSSTVDELTIATDWAGAIGN